MTVTFNPQVITTNRTDTQLECEMTGVKGRKTKYQTFDTSQLFVYAKSHLDEGVPTTATDIVHSKVGDHT